MIERLIAYVTSANFAETGTTMVGSLQI